MKIQELHLSNRVTHALLNSGITTVEKLTMYTTDEVRSLHLIGPGGVREIQAALDSIGLALRDTINSPISLSTAIDALPTRTDDLYLSRPSANALQRARILTVKDLLDDKNSLLMIRHVGAVKAAEIERVRERLREKLL